MKFHNDFSQDKVHTLVTVRFNLEVYCFDIISGQGHVMNLVVPDVHRVTFLLL